MAPGRGKSSPVHRENQRAMLLLQHSSQRPRSPAASLAKQRLHVCTSRTLRAWAELVVGACQRLRARSQTRCARWTNGDRVLHERPRVRLQRTQQLCILLHLLSPTPTTPTSRTHLQVIVDEPNPRHDLLWRRIQDLLWQSLLLYDGHRFLHLDVVAVGRGGGGFDGGFGRGCVCGGRRGGGGG